MLATSQLPIHSIEQRMYSAGFDSHRRRKPSLAGSMQSATCR